MPWSEKQNKLFRAAAHNKEIADKHGLTQKEARKLADEGVKKPSSSKSFIDLTPVFDSSLAPR